MAIEYLADHMRLAPTLARWHYEEWRNQVAGWSFEAARAELETHTDRRTIPTTLVALEEGHPVGSVSLLLEDLEEWRQWTPWLGSLFVAPAHRGRGIGKELVQRAEAEAWEQGVPELFLFTAGQETFYAALGWRVVERVTHHGGPAVVMGRRDVPTPWRR